MHFEENPEFVVVGEDPQSRGGGRLGPANVAFFEKHDHQRAFTKLESGGKVLLDMNIRYHHNREKRKGNHVLKGRKCGGGGRKEHRRSFLKGKEEKKGKLFKSERTPKSQKWLRRDVRVFERKRNPSSSTGKKRTPAKECPGCRWWTNLLKCQKKRILYWGGGRSFLEGGTNELAEGESIGPERGEGRYRARRSGERCILRKKGVNLLQKLI